MGLGQSKDLESELGVGVGWMFDVQNLTCIFVIVIVLLW